MDKKQLESILKQNYTRFAIVSYICTTICIAMGFYKMFVYKNSKVLTSLNKNAYVGGDAYNYIINSGYATAWFMLAGVCAIIGLTFVIAKLLDKSTTKMKVNEITLVSEEVEGGV